MFTTRDIATKWATTATKFLLFSSSTTTTAALFPFFLHHHHHHHISIVFLLLHHHISIVFYPSPTRFISFPPRQSIKDCQLPSLVHFVAMSRVVNSNRGFLQLLADCPVHQRQFLLKIATPQQLHALVQVLYNILMGHISIPPKISGYCGLIRMLYLTLPDQMSLTKQRSDQTSDQTSVTKQRSESLYKRVVYLTWPDQMSVTIQRSESLYKRVVVLLKIYWPLLFQVWYKRGDASLCLSFEATSPTGTHQNEEKDRFGWRRAREWTWKKRKF